VTGEDKVTESHHCLKHISLGGD